MFEDLKKKVQDRFKVLLDSGHLFLLKAEKRAKKQKLLEILESKQTDALASMTEEELKKELAALGEES